MSRKLVAYFFTVRKILEKKFLELLERTRVLAHLGTCYGRVLRFSKKSQPAGGKMKGEDITVAFAFLLYYDRPF